jgi:carbamate kinase
MGPKVEAACDFVASTGRRAAIGALADIERIVEGEAGTIVEPDGRGPSASGVVISSGTREPDGRRQG